jgi:parvulin-like peptidyl-prolyl isomerase
MMRRLLTRAHARRGRTRSAAAAGRPWRGRRALFWALFAALALAGGLGLLDRTAQAQERTVPLDRAKIAVGNMLVTERELDAFIQLRASQLRQRLSGDALQEALSKLEQNAISEMTDTLLLEHQARQIGISVSDSEIEKRVDAIVSGDPGAADRFPENELKQYVLAEMLQMRVIQQEVLSRLIATDAEIKTACQNDNANQREIDVGHILLRSTDADSLAKLEDIRAQLGAGADFETLAAANSEDPTVARTRGRLGFVSRGQFVKAFEDVAFALPVGSVSPPVKTRFGLHLIKVFGERQRAAVNCDALEPATERRLREQVLAEKRSSAVDKYLTELRQNADIQVFKR